MDAVAGQAGGEMEDTLHPGRMVFNLPPDELLRILGGPPKGGGPSSGLFGLAENMPGEGGVKLAFKKKHGTRGGFEGVLNALGWQVTWYQWRKGEWRTGKAGEKPVENIGGQLNFSDQLHDFLSGTLENEHFVAPPNYGARSAEKRDRKKTASRLYQYLQRLNEAGLTNAVAWVREYQRYLVRVASSTGPLPIVGTPVPIWPTRPVTVANIGPRDYTAKQSDLSDPQTQAILECLHAARDADDKLRPAAWIGSFDFMLPEHVPAQAILNQKLALYGAIPPMEIDLTTLDYAALKLTFDRSDACKIANAIVDNADAFSSHTLWARRGQGKSIALSQVILRLAEKPATWTFWCLDSQRQITPSVTYRCVDDLLALFARSKFVPRKINFVVDDLHLRSRIDLISSLQSLAKRHGSGNGVSFSFLFAVAEAEQSFSEIKNTIRLHMSPEDENRLYEVMTAPEPMIVGKAPETEALDDLLAAHAGKNLWKDDVQSLTDFIRQHSPPLRNFRPNWITDLQQEPKIVQQALPIVAVSQLLDLAVPDRILHSLVGLDRETGQEKRIEFPKTVRLSHDGGTSDDDSDNWAGYALASSYYARSLLRNEDKNKNKLTTAFVSETLGKIVERSLDCAEKDFLLWNATEAEFVRHIFQRAAKRKFGHLADIPEVANVAEQLFEHHGVRISRIIKGRKASVDCARWAGAFSYLLPTGTSNELSGLLASLKDTIHDLCQYAIQVGDAVRNPKGFVPLMWAIRALCKVRLTDGDINALTDVVENLNIHVPLDNAIGERGPKLERRTNQIVLSYARLLDELPNHSRKSACARVTRVYDEVEHDYGDQIRFDVENWIARAAAVWRQRGRDPRRKKRALYLWQAREAVRFQRGEQALLKGRVERMIKAFEVDYGPISAFVGTKTPDEEAK